MRGGNRFKLGLFASNCSNGLTMTLVPEAWDASWENNVEMAQLAEGMGLEFILPVARWHGYGGKTDTEGTSFETLTWASGLLASTQNIMVFGTVHVPLVNPVWASVGAGSASTSYRVTTKANSGCSASRCASTTSVTCSRRNG
jgi:hypothetical protein